MGHYDCSYCGESMGSRCCPQSITEDDFSKIQKEAYNKSRKEAEEFFTQLLKKKEKELYNIYKSKLIFKLYKEVFLNNLRLKSEKISCDNYRIYGVIEKQDTYLFHL